MRLASVLVPLAAAACGPGPSLPGPDLESRLTLEIGDLVWNPQGPFPQDAGIAMLRHLGDAPAIRVSPLDPLAAAVCPRVRVETGGAVALPLVVREPDVTRLSLYAEYEIGAPVHGTTVLNRRVENACGEGHEWVRSLRALVADPHLPSGFYAGYRPCPVGVPVDHAAPMVPPLVPELPWTEIAACGDFRGRWDESAWRDAWCAGGEGDGGDDRLFFWLRLEGDVPEDHVEHLQYAFAFETNGDRADDYDPAPDFARDAFAGTDRWYELLHHPARGWRVVVTDVRGGRFVPASSGARGLVRGALGVLAVPAGELSCATGYRASAFAHGGDFGLQAPHRWSGDREPPLGSGLHPPTR